MIIDVKRYAHTHEAISLKGQKVQCEQSYFGTIIDSNFGANCDDREETALFSY